MVFYIVAVNDKEGNPKAIETKIKTRCPSIANDNRPGRAEIHEVHVDKSSFKVSSLDQLMSLNESTQKLDTQLEVSVKKFEKVA